MVISLFDGCKNNKPAFVYEDEKIKGLAFVAPRKKIDSTNFTPVKQVNAEWIAVMPYSFVKNETGEFYYSKTSKNDWQWWGERVEGTALTIEIAHKAGLKVMLKPHIWLGWGEFTGHMDLKKEEAWQRFENGYLEYLITFGKLAETNNVEIYCIATEMEKHIELRPQFWKNAIKEIKNVYKGKLTYAENWDSYEKVPFWKEMDYIGIDAYFPLSEARDASVSNLEKGWKMHKLSLTNFSSEHQKPILFTEIGYRSCDYTALKPWETNEDLPENEVFQKKAYEAVFTSVWNEPYFAGLFIWKWFPEYNAKSQKEKFSPQGKLAEQVIRDFYKKL